MKLVTHLTLIVVALTLGMGSACRNPKPPTDADATTNGLRSPVTPAINKAGTNATAAILAAEKQIMALTQERDLLRKQASVAAAQVGSAAIANTNQPASPATTVVARETSLALTNLPPPDLQEEAAATARRMALLTGQLAEAERLYGTAQTEAQQLKAELGKATTTITQARTEKEELVRKHAAAQLALVESDKQWAATLKANEASNQSKLDAANKKADEAVQKAYEERHNLIVRILMGIGALSVLVGIGLAIATSGASAWRSSIAVFCGLLCFGLSQLLSHPLFNLVFGICVVLLLISAGIYLWRERKHVREFRDTVVQKTEAETKLLLADRTLKHVVKAVEEVRSADPNMDKALESALDDHTSPDSTRKEYVRVKLEHT